MAVEQFPVEGGHVLMFARALGDENPVYNPATAATTEIATVIAPPTFTQAGAHFDPDYSLRPKPGESWIGSGREVTGIPPTDGDGGGGTILHAEQHFTYHRTVHAGDVLSASSKPGRQWQKDGRRGGNLHFSETVVEYRDLSGELVVTARMVGVHTGRAPAQES